MEIGQARFKGTLTEILRAEIITAEVEECLSSKNWDFTVARYKEDVIPFLEHIEQSSCNEIQIESSESSMLKDICHIKFMNLQTIFLAFSGLTNLQTLALLDAPNLRTIVLAQNFATAFKPANKMVFASLRSFSLQENLIPEVDLSRFQTNDKGTQLGLTFVWRFVMLQSINFYAKMKIISSQSHFYHNNTCSYDSMESSSVISQFKAVRSLSKKFDFK